MATNYAPLNLLAKSEQPGHEYDARVKQLVMYGALPDSSITEEEYIEFFTSGDLMNMEYKGKWAGVNQLFVLNSGALLEQIGCSMQDIRSGKIHFDTEIRDLYLAPALLDVWGRNKQVYKPDSDFADALLHTEKLQLTKSMIEHLPNQNFYIDLSKCKAFSPIVGAFVFVLPRTDSVNICIYLLSEELYYFSFYTGGIYDRDGVIKLDYSEMAGKDYEVWTPEAIKTGKSSLNYHLDRKSASIFAIQMIAYLSVKEPDIEEDELSKKIYRKPAPGSAVKNRLSEVQSWDVGVRYGKSFREKVKKIKETPESASESEEKEVNGAEQKKRKSPMPHFKCAHWQHFWVGKKSEGQTRELRWIEPYWVNGSAAKDVVIHTV